MDTTTLLWYSSIAVQLCFCVYLVWTGLGKSYPTFTICLGCSVVRSLAAMYFMRGDVGWRLPLSYTYFWLWSQPFWLLLLAAVAFEVHAKIWREHEAVLRNTRPLLVFALLLALFFAALPLLSEVHPAGVSRLVGIMHFEIQTTQYISSVLSIFLLLSAALFVVSIRDAWHTSLFRHEGMLAVYFAVYAMASFTAELALGHKSNVDGSAAAALTFWFVVWITIFRPQELARA